MEKGRIHRLTLGTLVAPVLTLVLTVVLAVALTGCHRAQPAEEGTSYQLKGTVMAADTRRGEVSLKTQAIPGFMEAMTMSYKLAQPGIANELHPGDRLTARLRVTGSSSSIDRIVVIAQGQPDYKPFRIYNTPQAGQAVPDFKFTNQDGHTISIGKYREQVLLVTFIYSRCPLPDYCIRMSHNFAEVQKQLLANPDLERRVHLLSISFDPAYDTPSVLRNYGNSYTHSFADWDFAVPPSAEADAVNEFFDVGVTQGDHQTLTHSLSTAVITPDGKIFRWYPDNNWDPATVIRDVKLALGSATVSHS